VPVEDETNCFRPTAEVIDREHMWIWLPLADNEPAARLQHPVQLAQRLIPIRDLAKCGNEKCGVEGRGWEREVLSIASGRDDAGDSTAVRPARQFLEHRLLQIENIESAIWRNLPRHVKAVLSGARSDFEHPFAGGKVEHGAQYLPSHERARQIQEKTLTVGTGRGIPPRPGRPDRGAC
jgi:hypothetical protein